MCVVIGALLELSLLSLYTAAYRGIISTGGSLFCTQEVLMAEGGYYGGQ